MPNKAENGFDFGAGENDRQAFGKFRPFDTLDPGQSDVQHIAIEEQEVIEGDVLGGGGDVAYGSKMGEVGADFGNAEVLGVSFAMKSDIAPDCGEVGLLRTSTMELLKEKRQAVISHAVTRGLNPHVPLKPSGIEWLGDVPAHWELTPLKYVVNLKSGGTPSKANLSYWDGDVPWASSKDLKQEALSDTQDHITQKAVDEGAAELVPAGRLLIVVRGMILIHTFPVVKALIPMAINQDLKALTPSPKLCVDFLAWLLRGASRETLGRIDEAAHGTKVLRLEAQTSIVLPIPPLEEQREIVHRILDNLNTLDMLISEAQYAIDLLQERRSALISATVTGKIDVRQVIV